MTSLPYSYFPQKRRWKPSRSCDTERDGGNTSYTRKKHAHTSFISGCSFGTISRFDAGERVNSVRRLAPIDGQLRRAHVISG